MQPEAATPWLTVREAMAYTKMSRNTLHTAVKDGRLRRSKVGGAVRFHRDDLEAFMRGEETK